MFKAIKDARRRVVETVLENVGASERTVDEDYEEHVMNFNELIADMNECGAGLTSVLTHQKEYFSEASDLAVALAKIYVRNGEIISPSFQTNIEYKGVAIEYRECWLELNNVFRTSVAAVTSEQALQPLFAAVTKLGPEIEECCKIRNNSVIDFDSHRRRLKGLETKREGLETGGKNTTDILAEIARFQSKLQASEDGFTQMNNKAKREMVAAKVAHDRLLEGLMITTITCQAELFSLAAKRLEALLTQFPPAKVQQVRTRVHDYIKQGGVQPIREEKSSISKGLALASGKATLADLKAEEDRAAQESFQSTLAREKAVMEIEKSTQGSKPNTPVNSVGRSPTSQTPSSASSSSSSSGFFGSKYNNTNNTSDARTVSPPPPSIPPPPVPTAPPPSAPPMAAVSAANPFRPPPPPGQPAPAPSAPRQSTASMAFASAGRAAAALPKVIALYDHAIDASDELEFKTGDIIEVLEKNDDGWWKGKCKNKEGLFPVNYVKPL